MVVVQCSMAGSRSCRANQFALRDNGRFVTRSGPSRTAAIWMPKYVHSCADLPKRATDERSEDFLKFIGRRCAGLLKRPGDQCKQRACYEPRRKCRGHCGYIAAGRGCCSDSRLQCVLNNALRNDVRWATGQRAKDIVGMLYVRKEPCTFNEARLFGSVN